MSLSIYGSIVHLSSHSTYNKVKFTLVSARPLYVFYMSISITDWIEQSIFKQVHFLWELSQIYFYYIFLVDMSNNLTKESVNAYLKLTNALFNIIYHSQCLSQKEITLGFLCIAINLLAELTISILEWSFYFPIILNYFQHIFLEHLNSNLSTLIKADYVKQSFKVKYIYEVF